MPRKDRVRELLDPSSEALLAEHERLSDLYLYNADVGEKRMSLYLTTLSASAAILIGLAQFGAGVVSLLWPSVALLAVMLILGLFTFYRLVERRVRAAELLRAINRIHAYFVRHDLSLEAYFYWPPCDDGPSFKGGGTALAGLRDMVALLDSLFVGTLTGAAAIGLWPTLPYWIAALAGVAMAAPAWLLHQWWERRSLSKAESNAARYVRFPKGWCDKPPQE
jgi:hypothetical protein